ncbi:MAG: pantothenate synthetase (Pantoate--beta-alanine ligase) [candidate division NC10 bacterium CSP1-5]|nr:MAG: pantothenate synthetase (Pantoate--beta-alanine ligase) [candidate division NC10 bacterium CSP1-5]
MEVLGDATQMQRRVSALRAAGRAIGFVPTMGYLHEGHLSLLRTARRNNPVLAVSIFVNPTQFDRQEDLERYPVDLEGDLAKAAAEGADLVFVPEQKSMYPDGYATFVEVEGLTRRWEGTYRPGHFRGVTTIVAKLFHIVRPHRAYFGQKDYQQACVITRMARDLDMDIEVVVLPTVREPDGLAMSSRNVNLTPGERRQAPVLYQALRWAADQVRRGERDARGLAEGMRRMIHQGTTATIDYVAVCHPSSLEPLETVEGPAVALLAVRFSKARLIDNLMIDTH